MAEHAVPWEETFAAGLAFLRTVEGGLSDRLPKDDPGRLTNLGIAQGTLAAYRKQFPGDLDMPSSVRTLQPGQADRIFRKMYWEPCRCAELPPPVALVVFNAAVQSGPQRAALWLQEALSIHTDGIIGPVTIAAARAADVSELVEDTLTEQLMFEDYLSNWNANRRGWTRRLFRVCWLAAQRAAVAALAVLILFPSVATAASGCRSHWSERHQRVITRCASEVRDFRKLHPCPATGLARGPCPGWIVDHVIALECGGADDPINMQWMTVADAKAKDRWEGRCR